MNKNTTSGTLGTILPTAASMALNDRMYRKEQRDNANFGDMTLSDCSIREVGGERRYYLTATKYAVVRNRNARWFEVRADGDYSISSPRKRAA